MKANQPLRFLAVVITAAALGAGSLSYSQETIDISKLSFPDVGADGQAQSADKSAPAPAASADSNWHFTVAPYLWFPGVHGTAGALGRTASIHASAGDLLSNFRFGLMGVADVRYKRFVAPLDLMWVRLGDDTALPITGGAITANVKASEFILTPKVGYRVVNLEGLKFDALAGFRYWHLGQNLQFSPSTLGLDFSRSQNWVDPLVGGRIMGGGPRVEATVAGDVGGWNVGSKLDYQMVALVGFKIKPTWTLQGGYRYLVVNYRSGGTVFDVAMSGVVFGVSINLK
jgi:hypothetical protein